MIYSANLRVARGTWVGLWRHKRHVVFDPAIQPENSEIMFLYFVEGHALCTMNFAAEEVRLSAVVHQPDYEFALAQYTLWLSANAGIVDTKKCRLKHEIEDPPAPRKKCPECDGQGTWYDSINKPTYGVISEGPNIVEHCPSCRGHGFVINVLSL